MKVSRGWRSSGIQSAGAEIKILLLSFLRIDGKQKKNYNNKNNNKTVLARANNPTAHVITQLGANNLLILLQVI
jgi:hypothetical protein